MPKFGSAANDEIQAHQPNNLISWLRTLPPERLLYLYEGSVNMYVAGIGHVLGRSAMVSAFRTMGIIYQELRSREAERIRGYFEKNPFDKLNLGIPASPPDFEKNPFDTSNLSIPVSPPDKEIVVESKNTSPADSFYQVLTSNWLTMGSSAVTILDFVRRLPKPVQFVGNRLGVASAVGSALGLVEAISPTGNSTGQSLLERVGSGFSNAVGFGGYLVGIAFPHVGAVAAAWQFGYAGGSEVAERTSGRVFKTFYKSDNISCIAGKEHVGGEPTGENCK